MVTPVDQADMEWEQLLAEAGADVEPDTYMKPGEILTRPSADTPWAQRVNSLDFKGYVQVWDTVTGIMSLQPRWLLWQTMTKTRANGSRVFTLHDPKIPQAYGNDLMCPLHPQHPDFPRYKSQGFPECPGKKRHIPHQQALNSHIRHTHKRLWEAMEQDRQDRIREEDRQIQRDLLQTMATAAARGASVPAVPASVKVRDLPGITAACSDCGREFTGASKKQAEQRVNLHKRNCKAKP